MNNHTYGYTCVYCNTFIPSGTAHCCPMFPSVPSVPSVPPAINTPFEDDKLDKIIALLESIDKHLQAIDDKYLRGLDDRQQLW